MADMRQRNAGGSSTDMEMGEKTTPDASRAEGMPSPPLSNSNPMHPHHQHHIHAPHVLRSSNSKPGLRMPRRIHPDGESHRRGVHPWLFLRICFRSSNVISKYVNVLWPFVIPALVIGFMRPDLSNWAFSLNYIAIIPTANLIGFAGQELARKMPKVTGVLLETFLAGAVEIILLIVLVVKDGAYGPLVPIVRDAILGSILANLLLCLGACFFIGGLRQTAQHFDSAISEVGSGLLLTAGVALSIPCAFFATMNGRTNEQGEATDPNYESYILSVSRATAIILLIAYFTYLFFQLRTHHSMYHSVLEADEEKDLDRRRDLTKDKLTLTECVVALVVSMACVAMHAVLLVQQIEHIVQSSNLTELFLGLILVPVVEKLAEHLTAVDEAYDDQMNFALAHILGATLQTALFNAPLVVIVGWGLKKNIDLNFSTFEVILLILAILIVGNFIRDLESNYLEGALCIFIYVIIAVAAYYYHPNSESSSSQATGESTTSASHGSETSESSEASAAATHEAVRRMAELMARQLVK